MKKLLLALLLIGRSVAAQAPPPSVDSLLRAHRYPLELKNGQLSGPGADFLRRETARAQFFVIGEFHNGADIPSFTTALFSDLQRLHGFNYLALENDPEIIRQLMTPARKGNVDSVVAMARRYKHALQFWNDQEAQMIAAVAQQSTAKTQPVWGLDQVFGVQHILTHLRTLAKTPVARAAVDDMLVRATPLESVRPISPGEGLTRYINRADSLDFVRLRAAFQPQPGSEEDRLIGGLEASNLIYRRGGYFGNNMREQRMKSVFMENYREAERVSGTAPKVIARFGHVHSFRGINFLRIETLGNFLSEFARSNGLESFGMTVYLINEPGTYWTLTESPEYTPLARVGSIAQWYLVDLRPLRAPLNRLEGITPQLRDVILGFDAALLIGSGRRSTMLRVN